MKRIYQKGFTLLELIIVIAIIAILAVVLLAAINPVEQINKARDTGRRADATELVGGIERFYTARLLYPWANTPADNASAQDFGFGTSYEMDVLLQDLQNAGEIKDSYMDRVLSEEALTGIKVTGETGDIVVCFLPTSSQFKIEAMMGCADLPAEAQDESISGCDGVPTTPEEQEDASNWTNERVCVY